jgi:hypothetical protein
MNDEQREIATLAAQILSGLLAGAMGKQGFDTGSIRPHHIQASVNLALAVREEVKARLP